MKKICLCFFSGTGMTKYVVDRLIKEVVKHQITVDCLRIENTQIQSVELSKYDMFGIAYPVHSFNAPKLVIDFANQLPQSNGLDTFVIGTMGEDSAINFSSSDTLIKKLKNKGYNVFYSRLFEMPSNFVTKYDASQVDLILSKVNRDIPNTAKEIVNLIPYHMERSPIAKLLSIIGKAEWLGAHIIGKFFYAKSGCMQCGKCAKNCPNQNIAIRGDSVNFGWNCGLCMRCIYQCPKNVINLHQPFRGLRFDQWYNSQLFIKHSLDNEKRGKKHEI